MTYTKFYCLDLVVSGGEVGTKSKVLNSPYYCGICEWDPLPLQAQILCTKSKSKKEVNKLSMYNLYSIILYLTFEVSTYVHVISIHTNNITLKGTLFNMHVFLTVFLNCVILLVDVLIISGIGQCPQQTRHKISLQRWQKTNSEPI